jgi:hypothetical protein
MYAEPGQVGQRLLDAGFGWVKKEEKPGKDQITFIFMRVD